MDIVAASHLRWDFVYQRPQHLLSRAAQRHRVLFVEEPTGGSSLILDERQVLPNLEVIVPRVPSNTDPVESERWLAAALQDLVCRWRAPGEQLVVWHYAVMAEPITRSLAADVVVFDCMDELSLFRGAPPALLEREAELIGRADVVFTGGHSLWEAKRGRHPRVHAFPSSVDVDHFARARTEQVEPTVLSGVPRPRLIYAGVIDERIDLPLLRRLAAADIGEVVLAGPTAKLDEAEVPSGPHIHRLGMQRYEDLPGLFAHSDVGIMPFALNDATRFISPTKTPEYLAAGLPVVSTPIRDVERSYGHLVDAVRIAERPDSFVAACEAALRTRPSLDEVDRLLAQTSWDQTWNGMEQIVRDVARGRDAA